MCYLWRPSVLSLHLVSDTLITLAYFSIPFTLVYFVHKRRDLKFQWMFVCFAIFIVACGATHAMEIWVIWHPTYWLSGSIKAITALASVPTAILLIKLVPQALRLPSPAHLEVANADLQREIMERSQAEKEVERQRLQLAQSNAELVAANAELESFSYSVSHDLRTPLRTIDGFSHALLEDCADRLDDDGKACLNRIRAATQRMGSLIDDLLDLSRLSRTAMRTQTLNISVLARSIAGDLTKEQPDRQIELRIQDGLTATADPGLIRVALENLLSNAWKFSSKRASALIEFGQAEVNGALVFFVRDDGAGFDPAYADRLFGAFQRLHGMTEFAGTGIGLATVQRIVHRHGGRIWAESAVDRGATFYFTLSKTASEGARA
jgi:light-regulated signal transduction histidine kinase (bacteriophytochrome)